MKKLVLLLSIVAFLFFTNGNAQKRDLKVIAYYSGKIIELDSLQVTYPENAVLKKMACTEVPDKYK